MSNSGSMYKLQVTCPAPTEFTLNTVITSPRTCTPLNLASACKNLSFEATDSDVPLLVQACAQFVLCDFFQLSHRTGLYNRQRALWESLGRVTLVEAKRATQGFFQKVELPMLDLLFLDGRGRAATFASVVEDEHYLQDDKKQRDYLKTILSRAEKLKSAKGLNGGVLIFAPEPFPNIVLSELEKMIGSPNDPVARYESIAPEPLGLSVDLIEYSTDPSDQQQVQFRLVHPDLTTVTRTDARD